MNDSAADDSAGDLSLRSGLPGAGSTLPVKEGGSEGKTPVRLTLADWYSPEFHGVKDTRGNTVVFRAYVPWTLGSVEHLSRVSVPFVTTSAGKDSSGDVADTPTGPNGLGDIEFYDVALLKTAWGEFSVGPVFTIPTGTDSGVGKGDWTIGPAIGFTTTRDDWKAGFFSQGYFSFAGANDEDSVQKVKVQPIINVALPHGWDVGTSTMNFTYDFVKKEFTNVPIGLGIGKTFEVGGQKMKFTGEAEYNCVNATSTSAWTFRFTLEFWVR